MKLQLNKKEVSNKENATLNSFLFVEDLFCLNIKQKRIVWEGTSTKGKEIETVIITGKDGKGPIGFK